MTLLTSLSSPPGISQISTQFVDCCKGFEVTEADERELFFWEYLEEDINNLFDNNAANEAFGNKDFDAMQNLMDVHHLLFFLKLIDEERKMDIIANASSVDKGNLFYIDKWCIKCLRKQFECKGFSILSILKVFQLFDLVEDSEIQDGIGYMQIEGTTDPINRVS